MFGILGGSDTALLVCNALVGHPSEVYAIALTCRNAQSATRWVRQHLLRNGIEQVSQVIIDMRRQERIERAKSEEARRALLRFRRNLPYLEHLSLQVAQELNRAETQILQTRGSSNLAHPYRCLSVDEAADAVASFGPVVSSAMQGVPASMLARRAQALTAFITMINVFYQYQAVRSEHRARRAAVRQAEWSIVRLRCHRDYCQAWLHQLAVEERRQFMCGLLVPSPPSAEVSVPKGIRSTIKVQKCAKKGSEAKRFRSVRRKVQKCA